MLYLNKINSKKIGFHLLFWMSFYLIHLTTNKYNYHNNFHLAYIFIWHIVLQAIATYVLLDFIIFKLLNKRKYFVAAITFLGWLYIMASALIIVRHYLATIFPEYFKYFNDSSKLLLVKLTSVGFLLTNVYWVFFPAVVMGLIQFYRNQQRLSKVEEEKKSMELKVLKNQLNPHFLFNTLNNLYALTLKKDDKAPEIIAKLSEILDFVLYRCNDDFVCIKMETKLLENYISLEKLRYNENRLDIKFTKDIHEDSKISPLILLTFVENAFKHGVINETEKAVIHMNLQTKKQQIVFSIENTKPQNKTARAFGKSQIGLENVRKQLDLLYPKKHQLEIEEDQKKFVVKLTLVV
jgi:two-component system LytT family sensor kinase